ncbi:hypothetical protein AAG570_009736 [Ranatra chinensis]|uniref:Uncharacterized protein n=1 Tax=Ranatra chinensis TaxID=642074 RepID=A0ABD0YQ21_9HEMI
MIFLVGRKALKSIFRWDAVIRLVSENTPEVGCLRYGKAILGADVLAVVSTSGQQGVPPRSATIGALAIILCRDRKCCKPIGALVILTLSYKYHRGLRSRDSRERSPGTTAGAASEAGHGRRPRARLEELAESWTLEAVWRSRDRGSEDGPLRARDSGVPVIDAARCLVMSLRIPSADIRVRKAYAQK